MLLLLLLAQVVLAAGLTLTPLLRVPRRDDLFTQGLLLSEGRLYESAGLYGHSQLLEVDPDSGAAMRQVPIPAEFFAEGLAAVGELLLMLTWKESKVLVFDRKTFQVKNFRRPLAFYHFIVYTYHLAYWKPSYFHSHGGRLGIYLRS